MDRTSKRARVGLLLLGLSGLACGSRAVPPAQDAGSSLHDVLKFTSEYGLDFVLDQPQRTIQAALVAVGAVDLQNVFVTPTIVVSDGGSITPPSGLRQDFAAPVTYTVTAEDGSTAGWTARVDLYAFSGKDVNEGAGIPTANTPEPAHTSYFVTSLESVFTGTWTLRYSGALEARMVGEDLVLTLLEQTPTTQTVTIKVNDTQQFPTTTAGQYGLTETFKADHTYAGATDLGDTSAGTWSFVDLGAGALNRYALEVDATTTVLDGGPTVESTQKWYVTGVFDRELHLTRDPLVTADGTTTFDLTLTK
jgi:hypothetical protein